MGWFSKRRFKRRKRRQRKDEAVAITSVAELDHKSSTIVVDNDDRTNTEADIIQAADGREFSINSKGVWQRLVETGDFLGKTDKASDSDKLDGIDSSGFAPASHSHSYVPLSGGTMTGELQVNARLDVGTGAQDNAEIRIYKNDNNLADHIQFFNGTTRVGEIGCHDTSWLRINQITNKNIYTPRVFRADGGFQVDGKWVVSASGNTLYENSVSLSTKYLGKTAKAADSEKVDGINGASLLRSDADDQFSGKLISNNRGKGIYGTYSSTKTDHIWSMGAAYNNHSSGTNFGNLYGLAYKHTNNTTGGTMASGHMMVWCQNGTPYAALGSNIWCRNNITAYSDIRVKENLEIIPDALFKVNQLNGYTYDRTDLEPATSEEEGVIYNHNPSGRHVGVIAQEILEVLPEAVTGGPSNMEGTEDEHYSVAYGNLTALLIEAVKELSAKVEALEAR